MQTLVLIGGDARSRYLNTYFLQQGFSTYCFGIDSAIDRAELLGVLRSNMAAVVLPLPATRDGKTVNIPLTGDVLPFEELCAMLPCGTVVFGGMFPMQISEQFFKKGIRAVDYYDEEVVLQNAVLTAEGAMQVLQAQSDQPLSRLHIVIAGYGRVGRAIAKALKGQACTPTVAARRAAVRREALADGCTVVSVAELQENPAEFDILINTVPARLFSAETLQKTKPGVLLLEIASAPFGIDFKAAETLGRKAVNAQSLPGKTAPQAAAVILGEKIKSLL